MNFSHHCVRCGYDWDTFTEFPDKCPNAYGAKGCGVAAYDVPVGFTPQNLLGHVIPPYTKKLRGAGHTAYGTSGTLGRG